MKNATDPTPSHSLARYLRPEKFDVDPALTNADQRWAHWKYTFTNFLSEESSAEISDSFKLKILVNHLSSTVYTYIRECNSFESVLQTLDDIYIKPKSEVYARHVLASRKQQHDESIDDFIRILKQLAQECNYKNATAEQYKNVSIRDALISGISSQKIRQRTFGK